MAKRGRTKKSDVKDVKETVKETVEKVEKSVGIKKKKQNLWMYSTIALLVLLIIAVVFAFVNQPSSVSTGNAITEGGTTNNNIVAGKMSIDDASKKAVDYINSYILQGGTKATVKDKKDAGNGLYEIKIDIGSREYNSYVTSDGRLLFPSAIDLTQKPKQQQQKQTKFDAPDKEKSNVKFFVMSFCPFGNQAEYGLEPVYRLLKEKADWEPHYVIYSNYRGGGNDYCMGNGTYCSMHGIQEVHEDVREICIWNYYNTPDHSKWWDFVIAVDKNCNARNADTCWEKYAKQANIDVDKIKKCEQDEWKALLQHEVELNQKYGVRGSPTVFINDQQYNGARTPQAYMDAICSGFKNPPSECSKNITAQGDTSVPSNGGCG